MRFPLRTPTGGGASPPVDWTELLSLTLRLNDYAAIKADLKCNYSLNSFSLLRGCDPPPRRRQQQTHIDLPVQECTQKKKKII